VNRVPRTVAARRITVYLADMRRRPALVVFLIGALRVASGCASWFEPECRPDPLVNVGAEGLQGSEWLHPQLWVGDGLRLTAKYWGGSQPGGDRCGTELLSTRDASAFSFASSDSSVVTVDSTGFITARAVGSALVSARHITTGSAVEVIVWPAVDSIDVSVSTARPHVGDTVSVIVRAWDAAGEVVGDPHLVPLRFAIGGHEFAWVTRDNHGGRFVATQVGTGLVTARASRSVGTPVIGSIQVTVQP
jgi:hypothetical protein